MSNNNELTIVQLISRVMTSVGAVKKGERNKHQGFNFRGIDAVVNAISPALREHGVVITPKLLNIEHTDMATSKGTAMNRALVTVEYTLHGPAGDSITVSAPGEAFDSGDKATAKAMSVAMRTAMLQTFALPTDELDPDMYSESATPMSNTQQQQQQPQQQQYDPQQMLAQAWNSADRLQAVRKWAVSTGTAPDEYLQSIDQRLAALQQQQHDAQQQGAN